MKYKQAWEEMKQYIKDQHEDIEAICAEDEESQWYYCLSELEDIMNKMKDIEEEDNQ